MLDTKLADDIVAAVDAGFADQVKLTQDLVRYPSLRGQEHTAQDFLHDQMARRGLTMDRWAIDVDAIKHHPGFSRDVLRFDPLEPGPSPPASFLEKL